MGRLKKLLPRVRPTSAGTAVLLGIFASLSMILGSLAMPVYQLFVMLAVLAALSLTVGLALRPRLTVAGDFPENGKAGQPVTGTFTLTNASRFPALDVGLRYFGLSASMDDSEGEAFVPLLKSGETVEVKLTLRPERRGIYSLPRLRAYSTFPFNLWRTFAVEEGSGRKHRFGATLLVLPSFHMAEGVAMSLPTRYQPGGMAMTSAVGETLEYVSSREYRPGDPLRRIDFRSWARVGRPVVREYHEEYFVRLAVILDTYVPKSATEGPEGFPELEAAVSLSATLTEALSRQDYVVDVHTVAPEFHGQRTGRHTAHLDSVMEGLACVQACRENPFETVVPLLAEELQHVSGVLFVFQDWDASRRRLVDAAINAGCNARVYIVHGQSLSEPLPPAQGEQCDFTCFTPSEIRRGDFETL